MPRRAAACLLAGTAARGHARDQTRGSARGANCPIGTQSIAEPTPLVTVVPTAMPSLEALLEASAPTSGLEPVAALLALATGSGLDRRCQAWSHHLDLP